MNDFINRQAAIEAIHREGSPFLEYAAQKIEALPAIEIIHCKDCYYGEQDEEGWWYCRDLGCMMGDADGSGFCSDAERRTDE